MSGSSEGLHALRRLCSAAEVLEENGLPVVHLPQVRVSSGGATRQVDCLLCPRNRDGYETRLFFSEQLPVNRNWSSFNLFGRIWFAFSWQGVSANQAWTDILACHLEAAR